MEEVQPPTAIAPSSSFNLKFWREDAHQPREYQLKIYERAIKENLLVVIPTGLGKTLIAAMLAAYYLEHFEEKKKIILLAPTRPLIDQHRESIKETIAFEDDRRSIVLNGNVPAAKRKKVLENPLRNILIMTPQTLNNDLKNNNYTLKDVAIIIFDEAHHAMGNYAYVNIAETYFTTVKEGRIVGLTASPGSKKEKIEEVCNNLHIPTSNIELRDKKHKEVKKHTFKTDIVEVGVDMDENMKNVHKWLNEVKDTIISNYMQALTAIEDNPQSNPRQYTQLFCVEKMKTLQGLLKAKDPRSKAIFTLLSINAQLLKMLHLIKNLESQGMITTLKALKKMEKKLIEGTGSKADMILLRNRTIGMILNTLKKVESESPSLLIHPKLVKLRTIIKSQLSDDSNSRILVFVSLRDTVRDLVKHLKEEPNFFPHKFVGQANKSKNAKGMSQKEQIEILQAFKAGTYNILVATSVAEEGLDISECNLVIFYDNKGSDIKFIQRVGRTGRSKNGKVVILYTKGTSDETAKIIAQRCTATGRKNIGALTGQVNDGKGMRIRPAFADEYKTESKENLEDFKKITFEDQAQTVLPSFSQAPQIQFRCDSSEPPYLKENSSISLDRDISLVVDPTLCQTYQLEEAIPVEYNITKINSPITILFPQEGPLVGIKILNAKDIDLGVRNRSLHQSLMRYAKKFETFLILLDASQLDSKAMKQLGDSIDQFIRITKLKAAIFKNNQILHLKLNNIFKKYMKFE